MIRGSFPMARPFKLDILESAQQLEAHLKTVRTASDKERLQMLWWIKTGQLTQHQEIAQRLGRDLSTISRWLQRYRQEGLAALLEVKVAPGQTPKIPPEVFAALKTQLNSASGFGSYGEIVTWLKTHHNVEVSYATVYYWVHYRLKAKLKVPRPTAAQQDPAVVEQFKKT